LLEFIVDQFFEVLEMEGLGFGKPSRNLNPSIDLDGFA
jgi:hypothetical protein